MDEATPQLHSFIQDHHTILLVAARKHPLDTLPASRALAHIIAQAGNQAKLYSVLPIPAPLSFLDFSSIAIKAGFLHTQPTFSISADDATIARVHYIREDERVHIVLQDERGKTVPANRITISKPSAHWDAVILVGDVAREELPDEIVTAIARNTIASLHIAAGDPNPRIAPAVIKKTPSGSCSEMLTRLLKEENEASLTEPVATALLAGIIASTQNFQGPQTRPQTLFTAAYLIGKKADKNTIIRHLYKTKPLSLIKLWGHALSSFVYDPVSGVGYSIVTEEDFSASNAPRSQAGSILLELKNNFAQAHVLILGVEQLRKNPVALLYIPDAALLQRCAGQLNATVKNNFALVPLAGEAPLADETGALAERLKEF